MLLRSSCALCHRPGPPVCSACAADMRPAPGLAVPLGVDRCVALLDYAAAGPLVTSLKNGGRRDLVPWLADGLAAMARPAPGALVTWAPTAPHRRQERGYDQAELLARALARRWRRPCRLLLRRRPGPAQAGRSAAARSHHPGFEVRGSPPASVVVVDDVATTGATLVAAARALRRAGVQEVVAVVAARSAGHHQAARPCHPGYAERTSPLGS